MQGEANASVIPTFAPASCSIALFDRDVCSEIFVDIYIVWHIPLCAVLLVDCSGVEMSELCLTRQSYRGR
jgi:hypothetical protein